MEFTTKVKDYDKDGDIDLNDRVKHNLFENIMMGKPKRAHHEKRKKFPIEKKMSYM